MSRTISSLLSLLIVFAVFTGCTENEVEPEYCLTCTSKIKSTAPPEMQNNKPISDQVCKNDTFTTAQINEFREVFEAKNFDSNYSIRCTTE